MQLKDDDDLGWLAFRYVSNEMTAAEIEQFERRLAEDQVAREAVAGAVNLTQAVASVPHDVLTLRVHAKRRHLARWLVAAAAMLVVSTMLYLSHRQSRELKRLAKYWAKNAAQDIATSNDTALFAGLDDTISIDEDADLTVPSWLIEAVGGVPDSEKREDI